MSDKKPQPEKKPEVNKQPQGGQQGGQGGGHKHSGVHMSCCRDAMEPIEISSCCTAKDTAADAARAMRKSGCGCAPVVEDPKNLTLIGVVTERDVCCGVAADDRQASEVRVTDIMRPSSACCGAKDPVEQARRTLHEHRATSLPVVDEAGNCCGIVSVHRLERR